LKSESDPEFLIDPVMLDAAGQVVAFWLQELAQHAFHIFPFELEGLDIYSPVSQAGGQTECRARISLFGDTQLRSDIDLIREGKVAMRMSGWRDKRFHLPENFYRLRVSPKHSFLSHAWDVQVCEGSSGDLCCARLEDLSTEFLESSSGIWRSVLAHLVLSAGERRTWLSLAGTESRRLQWLLGRVAAKDAVRLLLAKRHGWEICPADIEIAQEKNGQPGVCLLGGENDRNTMCISIAHIEGVAMAAAAERAKFESIGVDIERIGRVGADFQNLAFAREERRLIAELGSSQSEEWSLRVWCAKEAVAKALGTSVPGFPTELLARKIEPETGIIELAFSRQSAKRRGASRSGYLACTLREGDLIAATSTLSRST
jgi:phosphopantetheinyl transferase (holo-ACP synthase)